MASLRLSLLIVDFLEASHLRYALMVRPTVYVSHIQQFWSTARVKTVDGEANIVAKVDGRQRTVTESSIRSHLKLLDTEDETTSLTRDDRYGEAFPTASGLDAGQDRENIAKTSAMPHEASPGVTSFGDGEGKERRICSRGCSKHGGMDQGEDLIIVNAEKSTEKGSDSTDEMENVLSTLGAANVLSSGGKDSTPA
ncbi:hypothetical protein Tco_1118965, partial [Tanacetum coccineum]